ncbi:hypothetical protein AcW1_003237 [Taiwanofungus camphoratus]|nr:hypothetical protein AcV5_001575 [Antrodia cinnamomea]KAI0922417.1 hypothetical protein AcV7_005953 [Antrodia cinnamomea]KAI0942674.1 hypothetical protein AcW1_003237 [Antrodia cinnamomea]
MSRRLDDASSTSSSTLSYGEVINRHSVAVALPISPQSDLQSRTQRTLEDVREQTAQSMALRAIRKAETVDGSKIGVIVTLSHTSDERFLQRIASSLKRALLTRGYLFILAAPSASVEEESPLLICGSSDDFVQRAGLLVGSKFLTRVVRAHIGGAKGQWIGAVRNIGSSSYDEAALWDVVRKAARNLIEPLVPPPGSRSVEQLLASARARLERITPKQAFDELHDTASPWAVVLIDIRPEAQRRASGGIHGSLIVERNVLEWRLDPRCDHKLPVANRYDLRAIIFCQEGYTSSLAAASLHDLGMLNATDIIGGYAAWKEAGLPAEVSVAPAPSVNPSDEY